MKLAVILMDAETSSSANIKVIESATEATPVLGAVPMNPRLQLFAENGTLLEALNNPDFELCFSRVAKALRF